MRALLIPFPALWRRRRRLRVPGVGTLAIMALADLVQVKKTQRDKDWPMVRRLVEADIVAAGRRAPRERIDFWLRECRTPETLVDLAQRFNARAHSLAKGRPALGAALAGDRPGVERALRAEEDRERRLDRLYWEPLRAEIERCALGGWDEGEGPTAGSDPRLGQSPRVLRTAATSPRAGSPSGGASP